MTTPLAFLALLLSSAVHAGTPDGTPAAAPAPELRYYYHTNRNSWWGDVVSRRGISLTNDMGRLDELCMIPPAADWIAAGAPPEIEQEYLHLVWRAVYSIANAQGKGNMGGRTIGTCGVNADGARASLSEFNNFYVGAFDAEIKKRHSFNSCLMSKDFVKGEPKYASHGKTIVSPAVAVIETLNLLLKSKTPDVVLETLGDIRVILNSDKFADSIEALVNDKSLTAKITIRPDGSSETMPLRVYAMRTLATIQRTERSANLLADIWRDKNEPPEIREGAIRAFAFIAQWPGTALKTMTDPQTRQAMHKTLYPFLADLMMIAAVEYDKKEEAGPKAQVSDLGNAASCAVDMFPKELRAKARKGEKY